MAPAQVDNNLVVRPEPELDPYLASTPTLASAGDLAKLMANGIAPAWTRPEPVASLDEQYPVSVERRPSGSRRSRQGNNRQIVHSLVDAHVGYAMRRRDWDAGLFVSLTVPEGVREEKLMTRFNRWIASVEAFQRDPVDVYYAIDYRDEDGPHVHCMVWGATGCAVDMQEEIWRNINFLTSDGNRYNPFARAHSVDIQVPLDPERVLHYIALRAVRWNDFNWLGPGWRDVPQCQRQFDPAYIASLPAYRSPSPGRPVRQLLDAQSFLLEQLMAGPRLVGHLLAQRRDFSLDTLKKAAARLNIVKTKREFQGRTSWALPERVTV